LVRISNARQSSDFATPISTRSIDWSSRSSS
jgi:hypothetical protein